MPCDSRLGASPALPWTAKPTNEVGQVVRAAQRGALSGSQAFIDQRKLMLEKSEATREHSETMAMFMENFNQVHEVGLKHGRMANDYKKWLKEAELKIAKQHGRTRTGGKPGRPRKQYGPEPPPKVMKISPRKRKRAK